MFFHDFRRRFSLKKLIKKASLKNTCLNLEPLSSLIDHRIINLRVILQSINFNPGRYKSLHQVITNSRCRTKLITRQLNFQTSRFCRWSQEIKLACELIANISLNRRSHDDKRKRYTTFIYIATQQVISLRGCTQCCLLMQCKCAHVPGIKWFIDHLCK